MQNTAGGQTAIFVLADEAPHPLYTPIVSDHPTTSNTSPISTYTVFSAPNVSSTDSVDGLVPSEDFAVRGLPSPAFRTLTSASQSTQTHTRRRRRRSSSEATDGEAAAGRVRLDNPQREGAEASGATPTPATGRRATAPSPKRSRLMSRDMRVDPDKSNSSSNGTRYHTNGSSLPQIQKALPSSTSNGYGHSTNGHSSYTNGSSAVTTKQRPPTYFGHDREEVSRLIIQALNDLGYHDTANRLVQESGYELESPSVAAFRHAILEGEWSEAEALLFGSHRSDTGGGVSISNGNANHFEGLVLAEGADKNGLRFLLRRQKYLELLEDRDHGTALMVLRQELTPLRQDVGQLHILSGFVNPLSTFSLLLIDD